MKFMDKKEVMEKIEELTTRLERLEDGENTDEYDDMLNIDGDIEVAGISFRPSDILKEMDPTAYRCGLNDYNDGEITEINDELESLGDELKDLENAEKDNQGD